MSVNKQKLPIVTTYPVQYANIVNVFTELNHFSWSVMAHIQYLFVAETAEILCLDTVMFQQYCYASMSLCKLFLIYVRMWIELCSTLIT